MHRLRYSLVIIVLIAIVGASAIINRIYKDQYRSSFCDDEYRQIVGQLANTLDTYGNTSQFISHWNMASGVELSHLQPDEESFSDNDWGKDCPDSLSSNGEVLVHTFLHRSGRYIKFTNIQPDSNKDITRNLLLSFLAAIALVLTIWISPLVKQLNSLSKVSRSIGQGALDTRLPTHRFSYIKDIENDFNRMANDIEKLVERNFLLSQTVCHDIRGPLQNILFHADTAQHSTSEKERDISISRIFENVDRASELLESTMEFTSTDSETTTIDLHLLVRNCTQLFISKTLNISTKGGDLHIMGNEARLKSLIENLLKNAEKHAIKRIIVVVDGIGDSVILSVHDDGLGVSESNREAVFDSNNTDGSGWGLGLSIVKNIATSHNGDVHLSRSDLLGGACFSVSFPRQYRTEP